MKRGIVNAVAAALVPALYPSPAWAQHAHLHVNPRWRECSIQLDSSLTQAAWHQFTQEAALVAYFRPLADARPMGAGNVELSLVQGTTGIDDADAAWNDTFVHPDSAHWLFEGSGLSFPSLRFRAGITERLDVGAYFTRNPGANYGFYGAQVQYNVLHDTTDNWDASARVSFVSLYGPEDVDLTVYGLDLLASKRVPFLSRRASVSPYAGVSTFLSSAHEKTAAVTLADEDVLGVQAMVGAVAQISVARLAVEHSFATVGTTTVKLGVGF